MRRLFSQMIQRPTYALIWSLELIRHRLPDRQLLDGAVSRLVYALTRPSASGVQEEKKEERDG
jgi:hypothetical protein